MKRFLRILGRLVALLVLLILLAVGAFVGWVYHSRGSFRPKHNGFVRFALCQYDARVGDIRWSFLHALDYANEAVRHGADVVVLPEFSFTTVHDIRTKEAYFNILERPEYVRRLTDFTSVHGCYLFFNHPYTTNDIPSYPKPSHYNVSYVMGPGGVLVTNYVKQALALLDHRCEMRAGDTDVIAKLPFGKVGMMICKDSSYPNHFWAYNDADLVTIQFAHITHWSNNPAPNGLRETTASVTNTMARVSAACALTLHKPHLLVNKSGLEDEFAYIGDSRVTIANGTTIAYAGSDCTILYADFPLDEDGRIDPNRHPSIPEKPVDYEVGGPHAGLRKFRRSLLRFAQRLPAVSFHRPTALPTICPVQTAADTNPVSTVESAPTPEPASELLPGLHPVPAPEGAAEVKMAELGSANQGVEMAELSAKVSWFEHSMDPAWHCAHPDQVKQFAIVHPATGDREGAPLILDLHSHGFNAVKLVKSLSVPGDHDIWKAPPEFYILVPDCSPRPPQDSPDFWWCGANHFESPTPQDVASTAETLSACENRVLATLEWAIRTYKIDRNRVYVCGNSMGGQGAMGIGLNHGDIFAAVKANVPAGVWFASVRLGLSDASGNDVPLDSIPADAYPDPPICIDYSSPHDKWSKDHDVIFRHMVRARFPFIAYWGNFGHAHDDARVLHCNDIVHSFDWLSIRRDEAYPVFTGASCDNVPPWGREPTAGSDRYSGDISPGQVNAYFRWKAIADTPDTFDMDLWLVSTAELNSAMFTPPDSATADVALRRLQHFPHSPGQRAAWSFGGLSGTIEADARGLFVLPTLPISQRATRLHLTPLPPAP